MNYQRIILTGNITKDAELRKSKKGNTVYATFSVAVSEGKDKRTFFPTVFPTVIFGELAEHLTQHLTQGRQVLIEGRIQVKNDQRFNVIADGIQLGIMPREITESKD